MRELEWAGVVHWQEERGKPASIAAHLPKSFKIAKLKKGDDWFYRTSVGCMQYRKILQYLLIR